MPHPVFDAAPNAAARLRWSLSTNRPPELSPVRRGFPSPAATCSYASSARRATTCPPQSPLSWQVRRLGSRYLHHVPTHRGGRHDLEDCTPKQHFRIRSGLGLVTRLHKLTMQRASPVTTPRNPASPETASPAWSTSLRTTPVAPECAYAGPSRSPIPLAPVSVASGATTACRYRVDDLTPSAHVAILIFRGQSSVLTLEQGNKTTNVELAASWTSPKLPPPTSP